MPLSYLRDGAAPVPSETGEHGSRRLHLGVERRLGVDLLQRREGPARERSDLRILPARTAPPLVVAPDRESLLDALPDLVEVGLGVVIHDRFDRPERVIGVAPRRMREALLIELVGGGTGRSHFLNSRRALGAQ